MRLPTEECFLIVHKFHGSREIPVGQEDFTELLIMFATNPLNEEFLSYGSSSIETNLSGHFLNWSVTVYEREVRVHICIKTGMLCNVPLEAFHGRHGNG